MITRWVARGMSGRCGHEHDSLAAAFDCCAAEYERAELRGERCDWDVQPMGRELTDAEMIELDALLLAHAAPV